MRNSRVTHMLDDGQPSQEGRKERRGRALLPIDVTTAIDRPEIVLQQLSTTLRIPIDTPMLVGGMSFTGDPEVPASTLYLFLSVCPRASRRPPGGQTGRAAE